jgi:VIT1/CCC1 family predicted Fe2+/Mn2+ transporter
VSVSSQRDAERADSSRELAADPESELAQLTEVYVRRGLDRDLAATVAERLLAVDPLDSHVRDQLGVEPGVLARPLQAAVVSALSFAVGAALPLTLIVLAPIGVRVPVTALAALALLALLGAIGARIGRVASQLGQAARLLGAGRAALRVTIGGGLAMGLTALIGQLVGTTGL